MRSSRISRGRRAAAVVALTAAVSVSCYEPAIRERVVIGFEPRGTIHLQVDTLFRQGGRLVQVDRNEIRDVMDLYELGRDPWLRGFERASARDVTHACEGPEGFPVRIRREATLPSIGSLVTAMPDATANFKVVRDDGHGSVTLTIDPIDMPRSVRENRRIIEREIGAFSRSLFRFSERQCDVYDYLAEHVDRREAVLAGLRDTAEIREMLRPKEAALTEKLGAALEGLRSFSAGSDPNDEPAAIAKMSFSAFDHDLCVNLSTELLEAIGFEPASGEEEKGTWCIERLVTDDLMERVWPESDPPLPALLDGSPADPPGPFSFTCRRHDDEEAIEDRLWELVLPRPRYELTWDGLTPPASD